MLHICVYMHSRFVENHPIRILEDGPLIFEVVLSHLSSGNVINPPGQCDQFLMLRDTIATI
jgi:hypothetical protein